MPHSLAPSTRIDSNSSLGTSRMKLDSTSTDSGIANAIDGRMIASRRVVELQPDDDQVDRDDRRLQRDRQPHEEQRVDRAQEPARRAPRTIANAAMNEIATAGTIAPTVTMTLFTK